MVWYVGVPPLVIVAGGFINGIDFVKVDVAEMGEKHSDKGRGL